MVNASVRPGRQQWLILTVLALVAATGAAWLSRLEGDGGYAVHVLLGLILVGIGAAAILVPAPRCGVAA